MTMTISAICHYNHTPMDAKSRQFPSVRRAPPISSSLKWLKPCLPPGQRWGPLGWWWKCPWSWRRNDVVAHDACLLSHLASNTGLENTWKMLEQLSPWKPWRAVASCTGFHVTAQMVSHDTGEVLRALNSHWPGMSSALYTPVPETIMFAPALGNRALKCWHHLQPLTW